MEAVTKSAKLKEVLKHSELFEGLSDDEIDKLLPICQVNVYAAGSVVACEGESCSYIQTIQSGRIALETDIAISRSGVEKATIDVLDEGGSFCWSAFMDPSILTSSGRCIERTEMIAMDGDKFKALLEDNPQMGYKVATNIVRVVSSRLKHTKETMQRILSVMFHDIKAPMAAVESYNRLLLNGFVGELSEEQKEIVQRSSKRLSELLNLVSNMIDFSRIDFGGLRMEEISLVKEVQDSVETMRPLAEEKGLKLITEVPRESSPVRASEERLRQVIVNLLSNAIKFTPAGGTVTVRVRDDMYSARVEVEDTGIGIAAEELPMIFDGFYRGLDVAERGAGLGLSIAKKIVEAHQGRIWAVSPCPETGKGSRFSFLLPKDLAHQPAMVKQVAQ